MNKDIAKKGNEARKPKIVFDNDFYTISEIPLNYRIDIKYVLEKKNSNAGMDRDCYSDLDKGLKEAQATARLIINRHFAPLATYAGQ